MLYDMRMIYWVDWYEEKCEKCILWSKGMMTKNLEENWTWSSDGNNTLGVVICYSNEIWILEMKRKFVEHGIGITEI